MLLSSFLFFCFPIINLKLICYAIQKKRTRNFLCNNRNEMSCGVPIKFVTGLVTPDGTFTYRGNRYLLKCMVSGNLLELVFKLSSRTCFVVKLKNTYNTVY